jgi:hypothetical protein
VIGRALATQASPESSIASRATSTGSPGRAISIVTPEATDAGSSLRIASVNQIWCRPSPANTIS